MRYLIDVNIVLAVLLEAHTEHHRAEKWLAGLAATDEVVLCPHVELGFLRVALAGKYLVDLTLAKRVLAGFVPGKARLGFVADASRVVDLPAWVKTPAAIADGHLMNVATAYGAKLATLDKGIPGAVVI